MQSATLADRAVKAPPASRGSRGRPRHRWMLPREHGAYASFLFPILTVLTAGYPTREAWLLIVAAAAFFLAHEPMLVVLGLRGPRVARERRKAARTLLTFYGVVGLLFGACGLWVASRYVQITTVAPLSFALMAFVFSGEGLGKTAVGQALVASALSLVALPLGLACGLTLSVSICVAGVWTLVGLIGSAAVRLTVDGNKRTPEANGLKHHVRALPTLAVSLTVVAAAMAAPLINQLPLWIVAAAWPSAVVSAAIIVIRPSTAQLRRIGWSLVGANSCTFLAIVGVLRLLGGLDAFSNAVFVPYF